MSDDPANSTEGGWLIMQSCFSRSSHTTFITLQC